MNDSMPQESTDDLLAQVAEDSGLPLSGDDGMTDQHDYSALTRALSLFGEHAGSVLTTVLNRTISFEVAQCARANPGEAQQGIASPLLGVRIPFQGDIAGDAYLLMAKKDIAVLSDLMMMGDGTAQYSEDHKDAIVELVNQILGSFLKALREETQQSLSSAPLEVLEFDFTHPAFDLASCDMAMAAVSIEGVGRTAMGLFLGEQAAQALSSSMKGGEESESALDDSGIGLSAAELDDLAKVAGDQDSGAGFFEEAPLGSERKPPPQGVDMLLDIELDVSIELGRANLSVKRILDLAPGSIVELDKMAGEPVDLLVNGKVVAKGEVVVVDENFGVRIVSLVSAEDRIRSLH